MPQLEPLDPARLATMSEAEVTAELEARDNIRRADAAMQAAARLRAAEVSQRDRTRISSAPHPRRATMPPFMHSVCPYCKERFTGTTAELYRDHLPRCSAHPRPFDA